MKQKLFTYLAPKKIIERNDQAKKRGMLYLSGYLALLPSFAFAGDLLSTLNDLFTYLTGGVGQTIAALAIVGVGIGCLGMGRISKQHAIVVVLGIGLIFGAKALLGTLTG